MTLSFSGIYATNPESGGTTAGVGSWTQAIGDVNVFIAVSYGIFYDLASSPPELISLTDTLGSTFVSLGSISLINQDTNAKIWVYYVDALSPGTNTVQAVFSEVLSSSFVSGGGPSAGIGMILCRSSLGKAYLSCVSQKTTFSSGYTYATTPPFAIPGSGAQTLGMFLQLDSGFNGTTIPVGVPNAWFYTWVNDISTLPFTMWGWLSATGIQKVGWHETGAVGSASPLNQAFAMSMLIQESAPTPLTPITLLAGGDSDSYGEEHRRLAGLGRFARGYR